MPIHRRSAAWIAPPVLAVLSLPVITGLAGASPAPESVPAIGWSDPVPLARCEEAGTLPGVPLAAAGNAAGTAGASWRLRPSLDSDGTLLGWRLLAGVSGARAAALDLPPAAAVRGPVDGRLVIAADDGQRSRISVAAPGGCVADVHDTTDVVRQAIPVPGSGQVLFHAVGRWDRTDLGVWRMTPGNGASPSLVLAPLTPQDEIVRALGQVWSTTLRVDSAGRTLAVQSCGESACRTRVVDLASGDVRPVGTDHDGQVVGLGDGWLVGFSSCAGMPCELTATSVADGRQRVLAAAAWSATTITRGGRLMILAVARGHDGPERQLIDPASGRVVRLGAADPSLALLPEGGSTGAGMDAGRGHVAAVRLVDGLPVAIDLDRLIAAGVAAR